MAMASQAQDNHLKDKVPTTEKGLVLANAILPVHQHQGTRFYNDWRYTYTKGSETATIYKYRNTKIKRALLFMIKGVRPKLA